MRTTGIHIHPGTPVQPCLVSFQGIPEWEKQGYCPLRDEFDWENSHFTIDPFGNLRPCNLTDYRLGNLLETSFSELVSHMRLPDFTGLPDECSGCDQKILCGGGCKADYRIVDGKKVPGDPYLARWIH